MLDSANVPAALPSSDAGDLGEADARDLHIELDAFDLGSVFDTAALHGGRGRRGTFDSSSNAVRAITKIDAAAFGGPTGIDRKAARRARVAASGPQCEHRECPDDQDLHRERDIRRKRAPPHQAMGG